MKNLYEKFCFLNGYLEQKLDDPDNIFLLEQFNFRIETKSDALTECYSYIKFKSEYQETMQLAPAALKDATKESL